MFLTNAWEKQFFELLSEVFLVIEYPHYAVLDDVGHKHDDFVRLSTLLVGEKWKSYILGENFSFFSSFFASFLRFFITFATNSRINMELTKADKRQLKEIIRRGILRRCEEWPKETSELINKEYGDDENAFVRCMEVTKRSRKKK